MAKLAVLLASFALVLFLSNASIHTTITVDNEDENPYPGGSCQEQIMKQNYLKHCQKYIKEQCSGASGSCDNPRSRHLDSCCEQLEKLDRQCRCPGLKQAIQQQMEGQKGREEMQEMQQMAGKIMSKCDVEPRRCDTPYSRTTITLNSEENSKGTQECRQQIQKQNYLKHCQKYMEEQRSSRCDNPSGSMHLDSCCEQIEQLDRQCRCPGLQQAVQQQMGQGQMGREEMQEMRQIVQKIMSKCDVEPRRCDIPSRGWF